MKYVECRITFHLYSIHPELKHPGLTDYDDYDLEFVDNLLNRAVEECFTGMWYANPDLKIIEPISSIGSRFYSSYIFADDYMTVNIISEVDCKPWPEKSIPAVAKRKKRASKGELAQCWWFHHITLPDSSIIDADFLTEDVEDHIRMSTKEHILNQLEKKEDNNDLS